MKRFSGLFFVFIVVCLFTACKKDPPILIQPTSIPASDTTWTLDSSVNLDSKILLNSTVFGPKLYLLGNNYFVTIDSTNHSTKSTQIPGQGIGIFYNPVLTPLVYSYISPDDSSIVVGLNEYPNVTVSINIIKTDTTVYQVSPHVAAPVIAINELNQLIVPVLQKIKVGSTKDTLYQSFAIYNIEATYGSSNLSVIFNKIIENKMDTTYSYPVFCTHAIGDNFYYASGKQQVVYELDPTGKFTNLFRGENLAFFTINDTNYCMGTYLTYNVPYYQEYLKCYVNYPMTSIWTEYDYLNFDPTTQINYSVVNNTIIAYRLGQLWEVVFNKSNGTIQFKELKNENLYGTTITSVKLFNNKVYVTTLDGLFFRPLSKFFQYK